MTTTNQQGVNDAAALDGWTAQQGPAPVPTQPVGYSVLTHQLPDLGAAESANMPPLPIPTGIISDIGADPAGGMAVYYGSAEAADGVATGTTNPTHNPNEDVVPDGS